MARGEGLRVRLSRIPGETPKAVLPKALYLPALLGGFGNVESFSFSDYTTIADGEFSQPAMGPPSARMLRTPEDLETLTVDWDPPWLVETGQDPRKVRDTLFAIGRSRRPVELLVTPKLEEGHVLAHMNITIRSIAERMKEGEPDSLYFTLTIREWRRASVERAGEGRGSKLPTTHKLGANDSLYSLSQRYYHSAVGADDIARANGIKAFGKKTALVKHARFKVGSKVKIPKVAIASINRPKG